MSLRFSKDWRLFMSYKNSNMVIENMFLEFQNKSKNYLSIFHYQIYALPKMKIKNYDLFLKFALLLSSDIQLNTGPNFEVCFVCKRTLNKKSFRCTKCDLRAHKKCNNKVFFDSDICSDCRR